MRCNLPESRVAGGGKLYDSYQHIGYWEGLDSAGDRGALEFFENGHCAFTAAGRRFGGSGAEADSSPKQNSLKQSSSRGSPSSKNSSGGGSSRRDAGVADPTSGGALLCSIDYSRQPVWLDMIAVDAAGRELKRIKWILEFTAPDRMRARTFFNERRPARFDPKDRKTTIYLRKVSAVRAAPYG